VARDQQLFVAVDAFTLNAVHRGAEGWSLSFASRRHGEQWGDECWTHYSRLSTRELIQLIEDSVDTVL